MNDFRDRVLTGRPPHHGLLRSKRPPRPKTVCAVEEQSFAELAINREVVRVANHRNGDRHRLDSELVEIVSGDQRQTVTLVNLSGGGAMIEGAEGLQLWDRVQLRFHDGGQVEAVVRWLRGDRHGVEFAEETRIDAGEIQLAAMLQTVIARSFPDIADAGDPMSEAASDASPTLEEGDKNPRELTERETRHSLIWSGLIHHDHDTHPVRLRNISAGGALIECRHSLKEGAELLLDLGEAGTIFGAVSWAHGDMAGIRFEAPFDLSCLSAARPTLAASRWVAPNHVRDAPEGSSPWRKQWGPTDRNALQRRPVPIRRA